MAAVIKIQCVPLVQRGIWGCAITTADGDILHHREKEIRVPTDVDYRFQSETNVRLPPSTQKRSRRYDPMKAYSPGFTLDFPDPVNCRSMGHRELRCEEM